MPVPTKIKLKPHLYVIYSVLGPHAVREDKDEAKAVKKELEKQGHEVTLRKYTLYKGKEEHESQDR